MPQLSLPLFNIHLGITDSIHRRQGIKGCCSAVEVTYVSNPNPSGSNQSFLCINVILSIKLEAYTQNSFFSLPTIVQSGILWKLFH